MTGLIKRQVMTFTSRTPPAMPPLPDGTKPPAISETLALAYISDAAVGDPRQHDGMEFVDLKLLMTRMTDDEGSVCQLSINVDDSLIISWCADEPVFQTWLKQMQAVIDLAKL